VTATAPAAPGDLGTALAPAGAPRAGAPALRRVLLTVAALVVLAAIWEAYKALGPADGLRIGGNLVLPRSNDDAMPHVWAVVAELGRPLNAAPGSPTVGAAVFAASVTSLAIAAQGFLLGVVAGALLALLMSRFHLAERGLLPWIVLSQTVPLVALAPLVAVWGAQLPGWSSWSSVTVIAAYLAFFPVSVGLLKGLDSPDAVHRDLFVAEGASFLRTLLHLRLPASVPYLLPALRLGVASAVIGGIVAEVSTGTDGGIGRTIINFAVASTGDPARPWTAIIGAIAVGLVAAGVVSAVGPLLSRFRRGEAA
jgi:NitT/TauT family transport system permease protein